MEFLKFSVFIITEMLNHYERRTITLCLEAPIN